MAWHIYIIYHDRVPEYCIWIPSLHLVHRCRQQKSKASESGLGLEFKGRYKKEHRKASY